MASTNSALCSGNVALPYLLQTCIASAKYEAPSVAWMLSLNQDGCLQLQDKVSLNAIFYLIPWLIVRRFKRDCDEE